MLAALRLAAVYGAGVAVLLLVLGLSSAGIRDVLRDLRFLTIPAAVCFGVAFLLLAIARRLGFTALWLCSLGFWAWLTFRDQHFGPELRSNFVSWSVLSAPLYAIIRVGFKRPTPVSNWLNLAGFAGLVVWALLAIAGVLMNPWRFGMLPSIILTAAWYFTPLVVTAIAIRHVHRSPE